MKRHLPQPTAPFAATLLLALVLKLDGGAVLAQSTSAQQLLEEGLYSELALAETDRAVEAYSAALKSQSLPARVAAVAHLRLGICLRWKGEEQQARRHFQTVAEDFSEESDLVRTARHYLGQPVLDDPSVFMPEDMLFYVELVDPRENIRGLSSILEGTPFQNPVDYYVSSVARTAAQPEPSPRPGNGTPPLVPNEAAFLNEGFLREVQLVEALAFGVPGGCDPRDEFLLVLDPGQSNILRGLIQMGLTISRAEPVGNVGESAIFRLPAQQDAIAAPPDSRLHLALGRDVVLLGKPRRLVEDSVERGSGRQRSLSDSPEFQNAKAARPGGIFFSYVGRQQLVASIRKNLKDPDIHKLDAILEALGAANFDAMSLTLAKVDAQDSLRLEMRSRVRTRQFPLWEGLASPPLNPTLLRVVPREMLGCLATRFDHAPGRIDAIYKAATPLLALLDETGQVEARQRFEEVRAFLASESVSPVLEAMDGIVFGLSQHCEGGAPPPWFAAVQFSPATSSGGMLLEGLISSFFERFLGTPASRRFQSENKIMAGKEVALRFVEPLPQLHLAYRALGDVFLVSPSIELLVATDPSESRGPAEGLEEALRGTGKLVVLHPRAILECRGKDGGLNPTLALLLGELDKVVFVAREEGEVAAIDMLIPRVTSTARAVLNRAAESMARKRAR